MSMYTTPVSCHKYCFHISPISITHYHCPTCPSTYHKYLHIHLIYVTNHWFIPLYVGHSVQIVIFIMLVFGENRDYPNNSCLKTYFTTFPSLVSPVGYLIAPSGVV